MFSSGFVDIVVPRVVSSPSDKAASIVDQRFNSYKTSERILHKPFTSPEGSDEDTWWHAEKVITVSLFRVMLFTTHSQSENHSHFFSALSLSLSLTRSQGGRIARGGVGELAVHICKEASLHPHGWQRRSVP